MACCSRPENLELDKNVGFGSSWDSDEQAVAAGAVVAVVVVVVQLANVADVVDG